MVTLFGYTLATREEGLEMASYKYSQYLSRSEDGVFDRTNGPGSATPFSGIYRCEGCGREIAANEGAPMPPQNHHQHSPQQGSVRWKLIVWADHNPK
jgi:hypothetical protein